MQALVNLHGVRFCRSLFFGTWDRGAGSLKRSVSLKLELQPRPDEPKAPSADELDLYPRLRLHQAFPSRYLPTARDVAVYLPPGYEQQSPRTYPVLYLHDGQNLFDGQTSFVYGRTWGVGDHADAAIQAGEIEPLIIVGIYNAGDRRLAEYTHERNERLEGGEAALYGQFITRELMPWIAAHYRIRSDRASTGIGGSSLGGLVSLYLGLRHSECFGKLALLSPSVWWNQSSILEYVSERAPEIPARPRIWLDAGDQEGHRTLRDAELLASRLEATGWRPGETLRFERIAGGTHDETAWSRRVRPMLGFLFPS